MAKQIWFGIPGEHMQWCPAPLAGAQATNAGYVQKVSFENGGADVVRSAQSHKEYAFNFNGLAKDLDGISVYGKYASGYYGSGLIYFADPFAFETNLFPAAWASPALIEQGWENIYSTTPTFSNTVSNIYNQPPRTATFTAPASGTSHTVHIAIPPTHTLYIGVSGSVVSGLIGVDVETFGTDGSSGPGSTLTLLDPDGSTRMNATFDGADYQAVEVQIRGLVGSVISITSMMAQLYKTGTSPVLPSNHLPGDGHTGLMFADEARAETYVYIDPPRKAMSTTLVEVGAWR